MSSTMLALDFINTRLVTSVIVIFVIIHVALVGAAYAIYLERKLSAWIQDRVGPNRVGPIGLLQPIADGLKLFVKEEFFPKGCDRTLFMLAPVLTVIPALISFAVIPWGGILDLSTIPLLSNFGVDLSGSVSIAAADVNIGVIYLVATASLGVYGVAMGGWASNNKFSFLGGLRASAQMVSYEIPMGLALLCVVLFVGDVHPSAIVAHQAESAWNIIQMPIVALIFYVCMLAEANRTPFDLAEAESELVGGWHTEYSSMKWALFFMGEYVNLFVGGAFFAVLFLGGWSLNPIAGLLPFDLTTEGPASFFIILLQVAVMLGKAFAMVAFAMLVRWTVPRFRFDQLMKLAWEVMIPISLVMLLVVSIVIYFGATSWMWLASLVALGAIVVVSPMLPRQKEANHRIRLIGSRFSAPDDADVTARPTHPAAIVDAPMSQA